MAQEVNTGCAAISIESGIAEMAEDAFHDFLAFFIEAIPSAP
jgi:hypothetical protein